ncbi:MAG: hypothetical protein AAF138_04385 [Planctomycetota bacterium]
MATHGFIESRWTARSFVPALIKTMLLGVGFASCATSATADLVVDDGEVLVIDGEVVTESSRLRVGGPGGAGTLRIINGGRLDVREFGNIFEDGRVEVEGPGSVLELMGSLRGESVNGSMLVSNGGSVRAGDSSFPNNWIISGLGSSGSFRSLGIYDDTSLGQFVEMQVIDGAVLNVERRLSVALPFAPAALTVSGPGSRVTAGLGLTVGVTEVQSGSGSGRLEILDGAQISTLFYRSGSSDLVVDGHDSQLVLQSDFSQSGGHTTIANGARVVAESDLRLERRAGDPSLMLEIRGSGSSLAVAGGVRSRRDSGIEVPTVRVAEAGVLSLGGSVVYDFVNLYSPRFEVFGGRVDVAGNADLVDEFRIIPSDSLIHFKLSAIDAFDIADRALVDVDGFLDIGDQSTIEIDFVEPAALMPGDVFDLLDFGELFGGSNPFDVRGLPAHLTLDTSMFEIDGTVRIVPTPGGVAAFALVGLVAVRRRR